MLNNNKELKKQYIRLGELKQYINQQLSKKDLKAIVDLIKYVDKYEEYEELKSKDTELSMLDIFFGIWLEEKKEDSYCKGENDIFTGINNLNELEDRYLRISLGILRLENNLPSEYCDEFFEYIYREGISGVAIYRILKIDTIDVINNVIKVSQGLRKIGAVLTVMSLMKIALCDYPLNGELKAELAKLLDDLEGA